MALVKQTMDVRFDGGISRDDDFLLFAARLSTLINGRFVDKSTVRSRGGIIPLVNGTSYSGDNPGTPLRASLRREEVCIESATGMHVADTVASRWRQVDANGKRCVAEVLGVAHAPGDVRGSDLAIDSTNGLTVYAWIGPLTSTLLTRTYVEVRRGESVLFSSIVSTGDAATSVGDFVRVIFDPTNSRFFLYWHEINGGTHNIKSAIINSSAPTTVSTPQTVEANATFSHFDACLNTDAAARCIYLVHRTTGATTVRHLRLSITDGFTINKSVTSAGTGNNPMYFAATVTPATVSTAREGFIGAWRTTNSADGVRVEVADLYNAGVATVATSSAGTPVGRITLMRDPNSTTAFWCVWDEGTTASNLVRLAALSWRAASFAAFDATGGFNATTLVRSVGVGTRPFTQGRNVYLGTYYYSRTQPTFLVHQVGTTTGAARTAVLGTDGSADICAHLDCGESPDVIQAGLSTWSVPNFDAPTLTEFYTMVSRAGDDFVTAGFDSSLGGVNNVTPIGADQLSLDFDGQLNTVDFDGGLVMAGACPGFYDGQSRAELGFHVYPETPAATAVAGGSLAAGTYGLTYLYEWVDAQGRKHQSAPAVPQSLTVALNDRIQWVVSNLRITRKKNVQIARFRTKLNGTVYYRIRHTQLSGPGTPNDPTTDTQTLSTQLDTLSDVEVGRGEPLPTTGGVIPVVSPPACKNVAIHQDRIVFSGLVRSEIRYTEERQGNAFFPAARQTNISIVPSELGRVVATLSMDDKLITFQEKAIGAIFGRGPNLLGLDNSFSSHVRIIGGYGMLWAESNSLVLDTEGIWFRNSTGIRHLNRGLQISQTQLGNSMMYKGEEVDDLVTTTSGATVFVGNKQIVFANGNSLLIWDSEHDTWSQYLTGTYPWTFSHPLVYRGELVFISTLGVYVERDSATEDVK